MMVLKCGCLGVAAATQTLQYNHRRNNSEKEHDSGVPNIEGFGADNGT